MAKGGGWERDVCKFLSKWIQGTVKPYIFWRGRGSGGMFTMSEGGVGEAFSGDIYSVRPEGRWLTDYYSIECKDGYSTTSLDKFLKYNKSDPLKSFWYQCVDDAVKSDKNPLLIYKKKGMPTPWVGIDNNTYKKIKKDVIGIRCIHLIWDEDLPDTYLFEMKEFFNIITPDILSKRLNIECK